MYGCKYMCMGDKTSTQTNEELKKYVLLTTLQKKTISFLCKNLKSLKKKKSDCFSTRQCSNQILFITLILIYTDL